MKKHRRFDTDRQTAETPISGPLLALLLCGLCFPPLIAADEEDDDERQVPLEELFKSELVFPQEQGEIQLTTLPTYRDGPEGTAFELPIGIEYGITDSFQIELEWDAYMHTDAASDDEESGSGQGNVRIGLMYSLLDIGARGWHLAAGFEYEFASGDSKFLESGNREDAQEYYLIFAKDLQQDSSSQLFLQVGLEHQKDGRELSFIDDQELDFDLDDDDESFDSNVWFANIGGYTTWKEATLSLELNLSEEREERFATPGVSFQPTEQIEFGLGLAFGLSDEADDYQLIGKLLWEFGD